MVATGGHTALLTVRFPVRAGCDEQFLAWMTAMAERSSLARGYLGTSVASTPVAGGGTAWEFTYRFSSTAARDTWQSSVDRDALAASAPDVFDDMPTMTLSEDLGEERTSMVISEWVPESRVADWRQLQSELNSAAAASPGFSGVEVFEPTGATNVWTTVITFQSPAELEAWKSSPTRQHLLARAQGFTKSDVQVQPAGSGSWFSISSAPSFRTPTWKQAMVVLAVLYPLVTAYNITIGKWVGSGLTIGGVELIRGMGLPFPAVIFLGNLVGTIILTWILMPFATRVMAWWLDPFALRRATVRGIGVLVLVYAIEVAVTVGMYELWGF